MILRKSKMVKKDKEHNEYSSPFGDLNYLSLFGASDDSVVLLLWALHLSDGG